MYPTREEWLEQYTAYIWALDKELARRGWNRICGGRDSPLRTGEMVDEEAEEREASSELCGYVRLALKIWDPWADVQGMRVHAPSRGRDGVLRGKVWGSEDFDALTLQEYLDTLKNPMDL